MVARSKFRGHEIYAADEQWFYCDTHEPVATTWRLRPCGHCNAENTPEGHDDCLGTLPGVMNACCGHGESAEAYIQFPNGVIVRGFTAMRIFGLAQKKAATEPSPR